MGQRHTTHEDKPQSHTVLGGERRSELKTQQLAGSSVTSKHPNPECPLHKRYHHAGHVFVVSHSARDLVGLRAYLESMAFMNWAAILASAEPVLGAQLVPHEVPLKTVQWVPEPQQQSWVASGE